MVGEVVLECIFTRDRGGKLDLFMKTFEELLTGMVEAIKLGLAQPW